MGVGVAGRGHEQPRDEEGEETGERDNQHPGYPFHSTEYHRQT